MSGLSTVPILLAFAAAGLGVWFSPLLFDRIGLGEFVFLGQACGVILILSALEWVFHRIGPADQ